MQFEMKQLHCLQPLKRQLQSAEETAEIRLADGMPEIGTVLGAWGQVILRSKEWNTGSMGLSCGVIVWVLYLPEEGEGVYSVQTWIPVQLRWDLPPADRDGMMIASCAIRQLDARSTSSRKMIVRTVVDAVAEAWMPSQMDIPEPRDCPPDVQLLTENYPVLLPMEAGEKAFLIEEMLTVPGTVPKPEKIMYYRMQPELLDKKVMAGKAVFRGTGNLHLVYRAEDGRVCSWQTEVPFSQYMDLDGTFEPDARIEVYPSMTSLELALNEDGTMQLKAGILAQFMLWDQRMITVAGDAYSPDREVKPVYADIYLPSVLDFSSQTILAEQKVSEEIVQVADLVCYPSCGRWGHTDDIGQLSLSGFFRVLGYDEDQRLCSQSLPWEGYWNLPVDSAAKVSTWINGSGKPQTTPGLGGADLRADVAVDAAIYTGKDMRIMTGMELGDETVKDPNRPSLILCRKGDRSLWEIAKETGSTVSDIEKTNALSGEPDSQKILLIPIR